MSTQMVFALCVTLLSVVAKTLLNDPAKCCVIAQVQRIQLPGSKSYVLSGALCSLIYIMLCRQLYILAGSGFVELCNLHANRHLWL
jgi:hypothetical protein